MTKTEMDILKNALFIAGREEVEAYKALPDEEVSFSEEFEEGIHQIAEKRRSFIYRATKTIPRRVAVVFIAAIITFVMIMNIYAIRMTVIKFLVNVCEDIISIFVEEEEPKEEESIYIPDTIENVCLPSYMIEGYIQIDSQNYGSSADTVWINDNCMMMLQQEILEQEFKAYVNKEDIEYQIFSVNGYKVYYYIDKECYLIVWTNGSYLFTMTCSEDISLEEIEKIISSME